MDEVCLCFVLAPALVSSLLSLVCVIIPGDASLVASPCCVYVLLTSLVRSLKTRNLPNERTHAMEREHLPS